MPRVKRHEIMEDEFVYHDTCVDGAFRCGNGRCIVVWKRCDGYNDCKDDNEKLWILSSDEDNCGSFNSQPESTPKKVTSSALVPLVVCCVVVIFFTITILILLYIRANKRAQRSQANPPQFAPLQGTQQNITPSAPPPDIELNSTLLAPPVQGGQQSSTSQSVSLQRGQQSSMPSQQFNPPSYAALQPYGDHNRATLCGPPPSYEDVVGSSKV